MRGSNWGTSTRTCLWMIAVTVVLLVTLHSATNSLFDLAEPSSRISRSVIERQLAGPGDGSGTGG